MRISARTEYAVLAMMELAAHADGQPMQARDIAAGAGVPKAFLDQLLLDLRRAGLVRSIRGPGGGYVLARPPASILLRDAIAAVEGGALCTPCGIKSSDGAPCTRAAYCALREVWQAVDEATDRILSSTTLAMLLERQQQLMGRTMYYI
jgi:Rrf2 family protein